MFDTIDNTTIKMHRNKVFFKAIKYFEDNNFIKELVGHLKKYKVVHLKDIPDNVDLFAFYSSLVDEIGKAVNVGENAITGDQTNERWTDVRYVKELDFTFRHSNTRQPLHTDAAYTNINFDINFFFAVESARIGGATVFIDGYFLLEILKEFEPALYSKLITTQVIFQKGTDAPKADRIITLMAVGYRLNWNYYRVSDANSIAVKAMCEDFHQFLEQRIVSAGLLQSVALKKGDCLFFHDDQVLHGRNSFYGDRHLIKGSFDLIV